MKEEDLVFGLKRKRKSIAFDQPSFTSQSEASTNDNVTSVDDEQDEDLISKFRRTLGGEDFGCENGSTGKLDREQRSLAESVRKLTKDPSKPQRSPRKFCEKAK